MSQRMYLSCELVPEAVERVSWLREQLLSWFERSGRSFSWRESDTVPYEVIIAEILLQRTTASCVARAFPAYLGRYPSWTALAQASREDLERMLRPLGLWRQKARALQNLAQSIEERGGAIPCSRAELERLRGIGPYTASPVLAVIYGQAEPLFDVNMARILERNFESPACTSGSHQRLLHALALRLVSGGRSLQVNWAALDFGALVCRARYPLCSECPLQARCQFFTLLERRPTPTSRVPSGSRNAGGR
jgi:A/G-specific adenine glycosylase